MVPGKPIRILTALTTSPSGTEIKVIVPGDIVFQTTDSV
jgi:hypothetical protein